MAEYFLTDALGSVRQIANASGSVTYGQAFDPFGNLMSASGLGGGSYGYAGEWTDASGLQYLRARYYSSATGRFNSKDPFPGLLTQPASLTPYVYALNSPVLYSDPSGEFIDTLFDAVSVGYDLYTIGDKLNRGCAIPWTDWAALGMDAFSLAVPFLPAAGMAIRFAARADDLGDFARAVNKIADNIKLADKFGDSRKYGIRQIGSPCSFSEDTLVATQEGEKPIDEVEIGDKVLAYDENSHSTGYFPVVDKFVHLDQEIVTLVIDGETIETTSEHPFFTEEQGWIPAGELWIGALILRSDGLSGEVESITTRQSDRMMFNLTIDQAHTFFVGNGKWLVHNSCGNRTTLRQNLGITDPNVDAHHLIPCQFQNHPLVRAAKTAGWDMNHAYNGVGIPNQFHREIPGHPNYNTYVELELDRLYDVFITSNWSAEQAYDALLYMTDFLKSRILR